MSAAAAPAAASRPALRLAPAAIVAALAAIPPVVFVAFPTYPQYDSYFHLVWGRAVLHGESPDFGAYAAPTEHPLYIAIGALASLLGTAAGERALVLVTLLSLSALTVAVYRLGERVFGRWPGVAAAAFTGTSFALLLYAVRAYVDVPFLALVLWAGALEVARPRRGVLVMALLAAAGLLRPEAWVLIGLYWLWCQGWRHAGLTALAALAPLGWAAVDAAVTGDPLHSLHATSSLAETLGRERGIAKVPRALVTLLADVARPPVALLGVVGVALAVRRFGVRRLAVPLALLGAGLITFVATGVAGLPILLRYLTVPAVALCLFAGYALLGFTTLPAGDALRGRWARAALFAAILGAAFVVVKAPSAGKLRDELTFVHRAHDDLVAILRVPAVERAARCGPITFPNYRLVPDTRWLLDVPAGRVGARSARRHTRGVAIFVLGQKALKRYGFADGASPRTNAPDPGFVPVSRNGTFSAYGAC
ncbi:MAG TPA: hypothetical protein VGJ32_10585 [Solirubrobacteraceae bacterium]|jgi:hypothetical protein